MKTITLFILLMTPRPDCVEKAVKANLTNCRKETVRTVNGWYDYNAEEKNVCDTVADPKPVPKQKYEILLEEPNTWNRDECYDKQVGIIEVPVKQDNFFIFASSMTMVSTSTISFRVPITGKDVYHKKTRKEK